MTVGPVRDELFARVDAIASVLEADIESGDELGRLPDSSVDAVRRSGLLRLKVPSAIGGDEAEPGLQFEVFERVAMINAAAAWCFFIWADSVGDACARLSDDGLARLLADGDIPIVCGGGGLRPGVLRPVPGGYRITGTFRYGSGIHAAAWVLLFGLADRVGERPDLRACIVAKDDLVVANDWQVLGMRGTGSVSFAADDVFVPGELTYAASSHPRRGGRLYRTGIIGYLGFPVPAVTLAISRRALDQLTATATTVVRGYARPSPIAERAAFQRFLGEADVRLASARALMLALGAQLMDAVEHGRNELRTVEAAVRAAGAYSTRVASEVLADTMRFAGGAAVRQGSVYERALRDLTVAASHLIVDESAYENHAQFMLGFPDADPLA